MKIFYHIDPKTILESHSALPPKKLLDEIQAIADSIEAHVGTEVKVPKDVLDSFSIKDTLNQDIWLNDTLNPKISPKLIQVAKDFLKDLNIPQDIKVLDLIFTGSLANFNWSKFSDIDLHIVLDFNQFDANPKIIEDYFWSQKALWNQEHNVRVFGYPIELYVQDVKAKLEATAVYSILKNKWLLKPKREAFKLDKQSIKTKANKFIDQLKDIRQDYLDNQFQAVVNKSKKLRDNITRMRNAGLEKGGEFSQENLVFKVLRRTEFMDQLDSFKAKAYDKLMSVSEQLDEVKNLPYDPKPELKQHQFPSFSQSSEADINQLKFKMSKAAQTATEFKKENPEDNYFINPKSGDGFYQVEIRHDGQVRTKHVRASGDMEQRSGPFQPSDLGHCKNYQNIAKYCFVAAGRHRKAVGASPAEDAANKALIIFRDEILDFIEGSTYNDDKAASISKEKMSDKQAIHKQKKDLETRIGRRVSDSEWNKYLETGQEPNGKNTLGLDPQKIADFEKRQAILQAKIAAMKAKKK